MPDADPFLRAIRATGSRLRAWDALQAARRELQQGLTDAALTVHAPDAAGMLAEVSAAEWHGPVGAGMIATGTVGGFPIRDDPAFVPEPAFAVWLLAGGTSLPIPSGDPAIIPQAMTPMQAATWLMLRDPRVIVAAPLTVPELEAAWRRNGHGADLEGALAELLLLLREGILPSSRGRPERTTPLPSRDWAQLVLAPSSDGSAVVTYQDVPANMRGASIIRDVLLPRDRVVQLWAPFPAPTPSLAQTDQSVPLRTPQSLPVTWPTAPPLAEWLPIGAAAFRLLFLRSRDFWPLGHEWGTPPDPWAVSALAARAEGRMWRPAETPPQPAYVYRAKVRQLQRKYEAAQPGSGSPRDLLDYANKVTASHTQWLVALRAVEEMLTGVIRDGRVRACGVLVDRPNGKPMRPTYEPILPAHLEAGRALRVNGALCWAGVTHGDFGRVGAGPYFGGVCVSSADLRALTHSSPPPVTAGHVKAWDAVSWRAFGHAAFPNLGSRPESLNEPHLAFMGPWEQHALHMGAWAAITAAEQELKEILAQGTAHAFGREVSTNHTGAMLNHTKGHHAPVPAPVFLGEHLAFDMRGTLHRRMDQSFHDERSGALRNRQPLPPVISYEDVRVGGAELFSAWSVLTSPIAVRPVEVVASPLRTTQGAARVATTIAAEKRLQRWLVERMNASSTETVSKEQVKAEAAQQGHTVSERAFARAWSSAVVEADAPAWSRPGRKSKQRIDTPLNRSG